VAGFFDDSDVAGRLQRLVFRLNRELRSEFAELGVTAGDIMALFDLRRRPGSGVSDLAAMAEIGRSAMSERIKRLAASGLVARDATPLADRRRVGLVVTQAGKAVMLRIVRERRGRMAARLARLDDAERHAVEAAVAALERLPDWRSAYEIEEEQSNKKPSNRTGEDDHEPEKAQSA
jgi:DNA-binding MarR family transcriptional regulator